MTDRNVDSNYPHTAGHRLDIRAHRSTSVSRDEEHSATDGIACISSCYPLIIWKQALFSVFSLQNNGGMPAGRKEGLIGLYLGVWRRQRRSFRGDMEHLKNDSFNAIAFAMVHGATQVYRQKEIHIQWR